MDQNVSNGLLTSTRNFDMPNISTWDENPNVLETYSLDSRFSLKITEEMHFHNITNGTYTT